MSFSESLINARPAGLSLWPDLLKTFALIRIFPIRSFLFLRVLEEDSLPLLRVKPLACPLVPISQRSCFRNLPPAPPPSGRSPHLCLLVGGLLSQEQTSLSEDLPALLSLGWQLWNHIYLPLPPSELTFSPHSGVAKSEGFIFWLFLQRYVKVQVF
ncbi:unnamed protein product [Pipistrellus nathusii]|uniref:Uncharacterized protein n=1 Tax=Pipistrellus nathusii TaxID=59473 RepID=A0ABN9ZQ18_PIPNA